MLRHLLSGLVAFLVLCLASPVALASVYFKYRVVAETGQNGFTGLGNGPSINDAGKVAFVARFANDSAFAWDAANGLTDIATNFRSSKRSFGEVAALIGGAGQVVALIPTLHESMLALLSVLLAVVAWLRYRKAACRSSRQSGDRRRG